MDKKTASIKSVKSVKSIKDRFPILTRKIRGKRLVYLDNAATTQKPESVINSLSEFYKKHNANVHRGLHMLSTESSEMYENSRSVVADFIGAATSPEIIFTRNATESLNLVSYAWGRKFLKKNDVVVITEMEHHSNIVPWLILREEKGIKIEWVSVGDDGLLDMESYKKILRKNKKRVKMVSVVHISNTLGTINPVKEVGALAHEAGAVFMVDAAQSAARQKLDVNEIDADFLVFSSHKMYGPTGIGVLYGRRDLLDAMNPWMGGGDMIRRVTKDEFDVNDLPWKFEAGTPNIADGAVLTKAVEFINEVGFDWIIKHERELIGYAMKKLKNLDGVVIYGPSNLEKRLGVIAFSVEGIHPHDISSLVDEDGVAIRAGHHCTMPLHIKLGISATARISFAVYNTKEDVDVFIESLKNAKEMFV